MHELNDKIARLEMRSEQLLIHLRACPRESVEAEKARADLLAMLLQLVALKGRRQQREATPAFEHAA